MDTESCYLAQASKLSRILDKLYRKKLNKYTDITTCQFMIMQALYDTSLSPTNLGEKLGCDRTTITRNTKALLDKALVEKVVQKDKRARLLCLTEKGETFINDNEDLWGAAESKIEDTCGKELFPLGDMYRKIVGLSAILTKISHE